MKNQTQEEREKEGLFRLNIIKLIRENPEGLTISKIAEALKESRYKTNQEVYNLIGLGKLEIARIGNYKVVRIK